MTHSPSKETIEGLFPTKQSFTPPESTATAKGGISITSEDVWQALCMIKASKACFGHLTKDMLMEYGSPLLERIRELIEKELNAARWSIETSKLILIPKGSGGIRPLGIQHLL